MTHIADAKKGKELNEDTSQSNIEPRLRFENQ